MSADAAAARQRRSYWLKTLHQWHWISAALSLVGLIVFAVTGITLNHAAQIKTTPQVVTLKATLPDALRESLASQPAQGSAPLPPALRAWLADRWALRSGTREAEWSADEVYLSLPRPGGDGWLSVDRASGELEYEQTDRGWVSYFNDLDKGRNAGPMWGWFIDLFAGACLLFAITGLFLLKLHAVQRPLTWPVVGLGVVIPLLLALLFVH